MNAKQIWETYKNAVNNLSYDNKPLPEYKDLGPIQKEGWQAIEKAIKEKQDATNNK